MAEYAAVCGVDPGMTGGLCLMSRTGQILGLCPTPRRGDGTIAAERLEPILPWPRDEDCYYGEVSYRPVLVCVEHVWAMRGEGVTSSFTFGKATGTVVGALEAILGERVLQVAAVTWQRALLGPNEDSKRAARDYVAARFPGVNLLVSKDTGLPSRRVRTPHQGLVDAICLADFARRFPELLGAA